RPGGCNRRVPLRAGRGDGGLGAAHRGGDLRRDRALRPRVDALGAPERRRDRPPRHDAAAARSRGVIARKAIVISLDRLAAFYGPATRNSPSLHFNLPFFKDQRVFETQTARAVWAELAALGYPLDRQGEWAQLPKRFLKDAMVADLASHVWHRWAPRLLLVH